MRTRGRRIALTASCLLFAVLALGGCAGGSIVAASPSDTLPTVSAPAQRTSWAHVVVVIEENHAAGQILGNPAASYFDQLAARGANFVDSFAETHPSQPNYLALFSGATQGVTDDSCPHTFAANNLGHQLLASGRSFAGYSESLPTTGSEACTSGEYARKHAPWTNFTDLPRSVNKPFSAFPADYARLPTLSFVIPNLEHDMHDGTVAQADTWLRVHLGSYARWAPAHRSLLLVTWDEDDDTARNQIPTIAVGAGVTRGVSHQRVTHYSFLRTVEDAYRLAPLGSAAQARPVVALGA